MADLSNLLLDLGIATPRAEGLAPPLKQAPAPHAPPARAPEPAPIKAAAPVRTPAPDQAQAPRPVTQPTQPKTEAVRTPLPIDAPKVLEAPRSAAPPAGTPTPEAATPTKTADSTTEPTKLKSAGNTELPVGLEARPEIDTAVAADLPEYDKALEVAARADRPIGTLFLRENDVYVQLESRIEPFDVDVRHLPRLRHLISLRDAGRALLNAELMAAPEAEVLLRRRDLNTVYDSFLEAYGPINLEPVGTRREGTRTNLVGFEEDPDCHFVAALERVLPEGAGYEKAEIFERTVVRPMESPKNAETPRDALLLSLDHRGGVDLPFIADLLGVTEAEAEAGLVGEIFRDPEQPFVIEDPAVSNILADGTGIVGISAIDGMPIGKFTLTETRYGIEGATWTLRGPTGSESVRRANGAGTTVFRKLGVRITSDESYAVGTAGGRSFVTDAKWEIADLYLSGSVRAKLQTAEKLAEHDPRFASNVGALSEVQPEPLRAEDITPALGASWIPPADIRDFIGSLYQRLGIPIVIEYLSATGAWKVRIDGSPEARATLNESPVSIVTYGTTRLPLLPNSNGYGNGACLLEYALNNKAIRLKVAREDGTLVTDGPATAEAMDRLESLKAQFAKWIWSDPARRDRLVAEYNRRMNDWMPRRFRHEHKSFPGMNQAIILDPHQRQAAVRVEMGGNTLLAHEVGTGKTYIMGAAAMEARRLGRARKPAIVVPNNRLYETAREIQHLYPNAKIMVAGGPQASRARLPEMAARIATSDVDLVVMPHQVFAGIPMSNRARLEVLQRRLQEVSEERALTTADETERTKLMNKLQAQVATMTAALDQADAGGVRFDELGIDMILVDEAHNFKNISISSKNREIGVGKGSAMADDLVEKIGFINNRTPNRNVVLATGTPLSNSLHEIYVYQTMMAPKRMRELGISNFDNWVATFAEAAPEFEITASGLFRLKTRLRRFKNVGDLVALFTEFADIVSADDVGVPRPAVYGGEAQVIAAEGGPATKAIIQEHIRRAENLEARNAESEGDSMFKLMADSTKVTVDPRLISDVYEPHPDDKLAVGAKKIAEEWRATADERGIILVFMDVSVMGKPGEWAFYPALVEELVRLGVDRSSIGIVQEAKTERAKERLFRAAREGRTRILIGSTTTLGTGSNVQDRVYGMAHFDVPWRPDALEQRNGRGQRRGNRYEHVRIWHFITKGSTESFRGQRLFSKASLIAEVRNASRGVRRLDDTDGDMVFTASALRAAASGDQRVLRLHELERSVNDLTRRLGSEARGQEEAIRFLQDLPRIRAGLEASVERLEAISSTIAPEDIPAWAAPRVASAEAPTLGLFDEGQAETPPAVVEPAAPTEGEVAAPQDDAEPSEDAPRGGARGWDFSAYRFDHGPRLGLGLDFDRQPERATTTAQVLIQSLRAGLTTEEAQKEVAKIRKADEPLDDVRLPANQTALVRVMGRNATFPARHDASGKFLGDETDSYPSTAIIVKGAPISLIFTRGGRVMPTIVHRGDRARPYGLTLFAKVDQTLVGRDSEPRGHLVESNINDLLFRRLPQALAKAKRERDGLDAKRDEWHTIANGTSDTRSQLMQVQVEIAEIKRDLGIGVDADGDTARRALRDGLVEDDDAPAQAAPQVKAPRRGVEA